MSRTTVLTNANVYTMVEGEPTAEAVAFVDGRIRATGSDTEVRAAAGEDAVIEDLAGRTVTPGFIDAHHHLSLAVVYRGTVDCGRNAAPTIDAIIERLREAAASTPQGEWIVGYGYDELSLAERRHPTRDDLDEVSSQHPIFLMHYSFHEAAVSSLALEVAGIDRHTTDPAQGLIERGRRGEPTGHLLETAMARVERLARGSRMRQDTGLFDRLERYQDVLFAAGITRICDPTVSAGVAAIYRRAADEGRLRMPVVMMPVSEEGYLCPPHDAVQVSPTGQGDDRLRVGPIKLFFDGGTRCAVCLSLPELVGTMASLVREAVATLSLEVVRTTRAMGVRIGRDMMAHIGFRYHDAAGARRLVAGCCDRGFAVAIHAEGNEAIEQAIDALAAVRTRHGDAFPPRIEHAFILGQELARRAADAGIVVVTQPDLLRLPAFGQVRPPPGLHLLGLRTLLEAGVSVAGSSDAPVFGFDPLDGVRSAIARRGIRGEPVHADEAVDAATVLAMYTRAAARACGAGDVTGTLEAGKRADLVVLSGDPAETSELDRLHIERTVLGGETVYRAGAGDGQ